MRQAAGRWAAVLAGLWLSGCGCSTTECQDVLRVEVLDAAGEPALLFSGTARFADVTVPFQCEEDVFAGPGYACTEPGELLFFGVRPQVFFLQIVATDGTRYEATVRPAPGDTQANGERCGSTCQQVRVTAQLQ